MVLRRKVNNFKKYKSKNYSMFYDEGSEYGIFLRSPIQKKYFEIYSCNLNDDIDRYVYSVQRNPLRRLWEKIIGNSKLIKDIGKWINDDLPGFEVKVLTSPIYFKREYQALLVTLNNPKDKINIFSVDSYGYHNDKYISYSGECDKEVTKISYKDGTVNKSIRRHEDYRFTYPHIVEKMLVENFEITLNEKRL